MAKKKPNKDDTVIYQHIEKLLSDLKINPKKAHYLVFSDGSGSDFGRGCGFASVVVNLQNKERHLLAGAMNRGTVNIAEMLGVLTALDYISYQTDKDANSSSGLIKQVHIVTDSKYCEVTGSTTNGRMAKRNIGIWTLAEAFARRGLVLNWHHMRRSTTGLNIVCDFVSKCVRKHIAEYDVDRALADRSLDLFDVNPWNEDD